MEHSPSSSPLLNTDPLRPLSLPVPPNPVFNLTSMFNLEAAPIQPETTSTAACHPPTAPAAILAERSSALWHELDLLDIIPTPSSPSPQVHASPLSTITSSANVASCALHLDHTKFPFDYPFSHLPPINFSISTPSSQISSMLSPQTQSASSTVSNMSPAVSDLPCDPLPSGCLSSSIPFSPAGATPLPPPLRKRPPAAAKAASLSSKTRIQKQIRRYTAPKSSLYCHLCARHRRSVSMVPCGNLRHGLCQKSVCSKCIATYVLDAHLPHWLCPHCLNNCPKRAKCFSYDRQTARRREKSLRAKLNCIKPADVQNENRTHCETLVTNSKTKSISSSKSGCL